MQFRVFLASVALFATVLATPTAETAAENRLLYKEKCISDGTLGWCTSGYYCKVRWKGAQGC
jgi:hypothetical protein